MAMSTALPLRCPISRGPIIASRPVRLGLEREHGRPPQHWRSSAALVGAVAVSCARQGRRATARASTLSEETYPKTWSNPSGAVLQQLQPDLWVAERPFVWNSIDVGGKMAVIRLADGSLWVHSPVSLDEPLRQALADLGPVQHIVSPNYEHVKWAKQWKEAFPNAILWGTPGMVEKFPEIPFDRELSTASVCPAEWQDQLEMCFADCERTPILGTPFFNEVIFYHRSSETLITTDIFWSYPSNLPSGSKLWKFLMDKIYLPFYRRFMVRSPASLQQVLDTVRKWQPKALLPCHGVYQSSGAAESFAEHLGSG